MPPSAQLDGAELPPVILRLYEILLSRGNAVD